MGEIKKQMKNSKHSYLCDMRARARRRLCVFDLDLDARLLWVFLRRDLEPPEEGGQRLFTLSDGIIWTFTLFSA